MGNALSALLEVAEVDESTYWSRTQHVLGEIVGCDEAHLVAFDQRFVTTAPAYLRTFAERADYAEPILRAVSLARNTGAYIDTELLASRDREVLPFYVEVMRPLGIRSQLVHLVRFRGRTIGVLHCNRYRSGGRPSAFDGAALDRLAEPLRLVSATLAARAAVRPAVSVAAGLTPRELQVAELAAHGFGNLQIAAQLERSANTVRNQLQQAFSKLGVHSRVDLANLLFARDAETLDVRAVSARAAAARLDEA